MIVITTAIYYVFINLRDYMIYVTLLCMSPSKITIIDWIKILLLDFSSTNDSSFYFMTY